MNEKGNLEVIDKLTVRNIKVRSVFDKDYQRDNPPPSANSKFTEYGVKAGLFASLTLSALLTIPSFMRIFEATGINIGLQTIGGISGFVSIDFFLFVSTFYVISTRYQLANKHDVMATTIAQVQKIMFFSSLFAFVVSVLSNLYFVVIGYEIVEYGSIEFITVSRIVGIFLAIAPAVQSVTTASVFALLPLTKDVSLAQWRNEREVYWKKIRKTHYGYQDLTDAIERLEVKDNQDVSQVHESFMKLHESREIPKKRTATREKVHEYLNSHEDAHGISVTDLANELELSIGLVSEERRNWLNENSS